MVATRLNSLFKRLKLRLFYVITTIIQLGTSYKACNCNVCSITYNLVLQSLYNGAERYVLSIA